MAEIKLTRGMVALVDDEDFERLNQYKWNAHKDHKTKNTFYATRHTPKADGKRGFTSMHIGILGIHQGLVIDHIDGDGLNNQRNNIRLVTHRQNGQNIHKEKTSKYSGIYWNKKDKRWQAQAMINGIRTYLGQFKDELQAYNAYLGAVGFEIKGQ